MIVRHFDVTPDDRIGPELGFGNLLGDAFKEKVLIIKYAVGPCLLIYEQFISLQV